MDLASKLCSWYRNRSNVYPHFGHRTMILQVQLLTLDLISLYWHPLFGTLFIHQLTPDYSNQHM